MPNNDDTIKIPQLKEESFRKYQQIVSEYDDRIPSSFEAYIQYSDEILSQMFGIAEQEIRNFRLIIRMKNAVKDLQETIELIGMIPDINKNYDITPDVTIAEDSIDEIFTILGDKIETTPKEKEEPNFLLNNCEYQLFFTGHSYWDLLELEANTLKQVIKKFTTPLATEKVIQLAEGLDHLKETTGLTAFRIQVADDFRIVYTRRDNITIILGITRKNGKDSEYTRYDGIGRNQQELQTEVEMFKNGSLSLTHVHYKTIEFVKAFLKKQEEKKMDTGRKKS